MKNTARGATSISPKKTTAKKTKTATKNAPKTSKKDGKTSEIGEKRTKVPEKRSKTAAKGTKTPAKRSAAAAVKKIETDEERRKRLIRNEVRRLSDTFKEIPSEKRRLVKATIEDAAFLTVTMQELRGKIAREGTECEYKNGENQYGIKQSPSVLSYLQMSQKLAAAIKILLECMPKTEVREAEDKFEDFIVERGDD